MNVVSTNSGIFTEILISYHTLNDITLISSFVTSSVGIWGIWESSVLNMILPMVSLLIFDVVNIVRSYSDVFSQIFISYHTFNLMSTVCGKISTRRGIWLVWESFSLGMMSMMNSFNEVNSITTNFGVFRKVLISDHSINGMSSISAMVTIDISIWCVRKGSCLGMTTMVMMLFSVVNWIATNSCIFSKIFISNHSFNGVSSISANVSTSISVWSIRKSLKESMILGDLAVDLCKSFLHGLNFHTFFWTL